MADKIKFPTHPGLAHCPLCGYNYCPDIEYEVNAHMEYCKAPGLKWHEHSRHMLLQEDEPRGYFGFKCGHCGEGMTVLGIWLDGRQRLIINGRCPKCQYWDVRKVGLERNTKVWIDQRQSFQTPEGKLSIRPPRPRASSVSRKLRLEIIERDNFTCRYCGHHDKTMKSLQVDHVTPVSKGGSNDPSNLATACTTCNLSKKDKEVKKVGPLLANIIQPRRKPSKPKPKPKPDPKPNPCPYANRKPRKLRKRKPAGTD